LHVWVIQWLCPLLFICCLLLLQSTLAVVVQIVLPVELEFVDNTSIAAIVPFAVVGRKASVELNIVAVELSAVVVPFAVYKQMVTVEPKLLRLQLLDHFSLLKE